MIKKFEEFIKENTEIPGIFDENKELLKQFFDFLLKANKRPKAKYHLAINTNNAPEWNGEIDEKHRHIWDAFVDQLKQLDIIPMRVVEEVVDKDGNCIDPNFRNILVDLDEDDYIADWDEDKLTFEIPAEIFDEDGYDFITEKLLEITEEGYEPEHTYEEDDDFPYEEGKVKNFSKYVNENKIEPADIPEEFTGDPKTDSYLAAAIYKHNDDKVYINCDYEDMKMFEPFKKAQKEGNKYYDIWTSIVNWIKGKSDKDLQGLTVIQKDQILLSTFKSVLQKQENLNKITPYKGNNWTVYNYNRCKDVWEKYTNLAKKFYPNKQDSMERINFRRERYENFIRKEGIEKYAKNWIPQFSRSYPID